MGLTKDYKRIHCLGFGRFSWKVTVKVTMKFSKQGGIGVGKCLNQNSQDFRFCGIADCPVRNYATVFYFIQIGDLIVSFSEN